MNEQKISNTALMIKTEIEAMQKFCGADMKPEDRLKAWIWLMIFNLFKVLIVGIITMVLGSQGIGKISSYVSGLLTP
jgi:hypothetical protein